MDNKITRRSLLSTGAALIAASAMEANPQPAAEQVRFGLIADVHHYRMPGAHDRLRSFLSEANRRPLDFLIQLGDLCDGYKAQLTSEQKEFVADWQSVRLPQYNVLGNHEMDHGSKQQIMDVLHMPKSYYSFDMRGFHFIVLDCMHLLENGKIVDYVEGSYFRHTASEINLIDPEQLEWLKADLKSTSFPTIVFAHPCINGFWAKGAETTRANVRDALSMANQQAGWQKVIACFTGHHHVDYLSQWKGVNYFMVNSASYYWVGEKFGSMAKYEDALFTFVTIDHAGTIQVEGKSSVFVPPTPADLQFPDAPLLSASIEGRKVLFSARS
jgi:3',5'-cyclic AMP phosphodiesterase CpdA